MASVSIVNDLVGLFTDLNVEVRRLATQSELIIARLDSWSTTETSSPLPICGAPCRAAEVAA